MKYNQLVLIEVHNCGPFIERFVSDKKITVTRAVRYLEERDGMNFERDNITFLDEPEEKRLY